MNNIQLKQNVKFCECAGETVEEQWMKVPYDEGLAAHIGPESCVYARKGISEPIGTTPWIIKK